MDAVLSKNNVAIRLTSERWLHITEGHSELAGYYFEILETISDPDYIYEGNSEELLAVKELANTKFIIVVYKENNQNDGFVITAFISNKINYLLNKKLLWKKQK